MNISEYLKNLRIDKKLGWKDIERAFILKGLNKPNISAIESGKHNPNWDTIVSYIEACGERVIGLTTESINSESTQR